jgi:tetratricopeptide (TPR) repeat protein
MTRFGRIVPALAALVGLLGCGDRAERAPGAASPAGYEAAAREYAALVARDSTSALARYDLGTALLLSKKYAEARDPLEVATRAKSTELQERAHYNLGNTRLEPAFEQPKMEGRDAELRKSIEAFKKALLLAPGDLDAKWNLELARRLLATPPEGGSGGGGGGGGGGDEQRPGEQGPRPEPEEGGGGGMSRAEAERILAGSQAQELGVQREKLQKPQPSNPTAH